MKHGDSCSAKKGATVKKGDLSRSRPEGFFPKYENAKRKRANSANGDGISASQIQKAWNKAGKKQRGNEQDSTVKFNIQN